MQKRQAGFTLIELLIVIAIIGILSSVVMVAMAGAREKAKSAKTNSEVQSLHKKMQECVLDGKEVAFPAAGDPLCEGSDTLMPDFSQEGFFNIDFYGLPDWEGESITRIQLAKLNSDETTYTIIFCGMNAGPTWFNISGAEENGDPYTPDFSGSSGCYTLKASPSMSAR